jgi:DNA-binding MltR family transcriptional regulator
LDLIDDAIYKDLRALNDIRNAFAHATDQLHFDSPKLVRHFQKLSGWTKTADPRKLFHDRANACVEPLKHVFQVSLLINALRRKSSAIPKRFGSPQSGVR